ncbi:MAG: acyl-CoA dehydrogenase family protein [Spirochaetaceae bacterium]|nr:acyl-CoA dehydrogenase family protein [Spirochaetaceae bacterium]
MDFEYPAEAEAFHDELLEFLEAELPPWWVNFLSGDERNIPFTREFCKKLAAKGWLTMAWPKEYGGGEADIWHQNVVREVMWGMGEPRGPQYMNLNFIGPAIMTFGTDEQKDRYLKPMAAGEVIWCQGFSEQDAGSDLASLATRAEDTGGGFRINGQKSWVSYGIYAEQCLLMARTDPDAPKHRGISMFVVDMATPGVAVRTIETVGGPPQLYELTFEDVDIPYDALLGPRNDGWRVAMAALDHERIGLAYGGRTQVQLDELVGFAQETTDSSGRRLSERGDVRAKLIRLRALNRAQRLIMYRVFADQTGAGAAVVDPSIYKVLGGQTTLQAAQLAMELAGSRGALLEADPMATLGDGAYAWWGHALPVQVAGGSSEIQRNIIAQHGLGIPRGR